MGRRKKQQPLVQVHQEVLGAHNTDGVTLVFRTVLAPGVNIRVLAAGGMSISVKRGIERLHVNSNLLANPLSKQFKDSSLTWPTAIMSTYASSSHLRHFTSWKLSESSNTSLTGTPWVIELHSNSPWSSRCFSLMRSVSSLRFSNSIWQWWQ